MSKRPLADAQWARIEPLIPGKKGDRSRSDTNNRLLVDAILWLARGIGRSKGGIATRIHAAVDAPDLPIRFAITPGQ